MTALRKILNEFKQTAQTNREQGTYFEQLVKSYLLYEPLYRDLFNDKVYLWEEWREEWQKQGNPDPGPDTGIDLVAVEGETKDPRIFAIQAKFYSKDTRLFKKNIDSFLSEMGKPPYTNGMLFTTTTQISDPAEDAFKGRDKDVVTVTLSDLENSQIDWEKYQLEKPVKLKPQKTLYEHQQIALDKVLTGLKKADRGKLIMACGTGKTLTALKIAEHQAGKGGRVLFLVPSLALLSQTLTEWTQESAIPLHNFAVCSDSDIGKKKRSSTDEVQMLKHELRYPATTKADKLAEELTKRHDKHHLSIVYATYHSIKVISDAQKEYGLEPFDLVICDEAHRTTGSTWEGDDESHFVAVHDNKYLKADKRIYMTATPRIYGNAAKIKQEMGGVVLYSMDDEKLFGKELYVINFSEAVERKLLCDYKVIVLAVDEDYISHQLQELFKDENNSLKVDDAGRIVGCWKALAKLDLNEELGGDMNPMRRAVAFCQVIKHKENAKVHKVSSMQIADRFQQVVATYQQAEQAEGRDHGTLICEAEHIDGNMNASQKQEKIDWLKEETPDNTCRILSNVYCLSEGVDVPALDAVLFLTPRNSQVGVVQSVGRVMRNAPGKKRGYIVLPVVIPAGMEPHEALNDNKVYKVVWDVLQALRSHDDRFDAHINKIDLIGSNPSKMEVISITGDVQKKSKRSKSTGRGNYSIGETPDRKVQEQRNLQFTVGEMERALYAKVVKKCGNRFHWEEWADDIAKIANTHITRIRTIVKDERNKKEVAAFNAFANEIRDDLNESVTDEEVIEMLAQHLITKPVFDALFEGYSFASENPVSQAMQKVLDILQKHRLETEADTLQKFYDSVKMRAKDIDNAKGKQKIIVELYDKFFRNAFPKMTERLGIVYTPVEVVDFIIHSVNDILQKEFNQTLGSRGVHIIDPFTGTGTFITRLLQSGLIKPTELEHKYKNEIHANEIVLLAYYIAAMNIEFVYNDLTGGNYMPFEGICLTDTFQMYEKDDMISELLVDNSERRKRQKKLDIRVIIGNPPYSTGQRSANDDAANIKYPTLDNRIATEYIARSQNKGGKHSHYDSYIRAIRWASDRVGESGIISFVTNAGWLDANSMDGMRQCLAEEFSNIYVFHLRGNARTQGEQRRKEKDNVFGTGSRAPIAISLFVKNPDATEHGKIYIHDIGDYLNQEQKLATINRFKSISGITKADSWTDIMPDRHADWLDQRDESFDSSLLLGSKQKTANEPLLFSLYSSGVVTSRDTWVYGYSRKVVVENCQNMTEFYNQEIERYAEYLDAGNPKIKEIQKFVKKDLSRISWGGGNWQSSFKKLQKENFDANLITQSIFRPYTKMWHYGHKRFNHSFYSMLKIFPEPGMDNLAIAVTGIGVKAGFSCLMLGTLPCYDCIEKGQCFPRWRYELLDGDEAETFSLLEAAQDTEIITAASGRHYRRYSAINEQAMAKVRKAYPDLKISEDDIFHYLYGLLHSEEYRTRFGANLSKEIPRLPFVRTADDFIRFRDAGKALADLHTDYETVQPYPATFNITGDRKIKDLKEEDYRVVTKMKHPKVKNDEGKSINDLSTVIYNDRITIENIPTEAYDYVVNAKPAIEWVIERQCVKTDKDSGIVSDANLYATETVNNPAYPLELLLRVITVSLETTKITNSLPPLNID